MGKLAQHPSLRAPIPFERPTCSARAINCPLVSSPCNDECSSRIGCWWATHWLAGPLSNGVGSMSSALGTFLLAPRSSCLRRLAPEKEWIIRESGNRIKRSSNSRDELHLRSPKGLPPSSQRVRDCGCKVTDSCTIWPSLERQLACQTQTYGLSSNKLATTTVSELEWPSHSSLVHRDGSNHCPALWVGQKCCGLGANRVQLDGISCLVWFNFEPLSGTWMRRPPSAGRTSILAKANWSFPAEQLELEFRFVSHQSGGNSRPATRIALRAEPIKSWATQEFGAGCRWARLASPPRQPLYFH